MLSRVVFYVKIVSSIFKFTFVLISQKLGSLVHKATYKAVPHPKHVVIVGGSFGGVELARRLANTLPTGYDVLLVERNSHFNHTFAFPRFSVIGGHEHKAFIPYTGLASSVPAGALTTVHDFVEEIQGGQVRLLSGESIEYEYLAIATGTSQPAPARLKAHDKAGACGELQGYQQAIARASKIAVIGGGAVGIEIAADIKSYFADKSVTLIHSRDRLLNRFGARLHGVVAAELEKVGVRVVLEQRPKLPPMATGFVDSPVELALGEDKPETFDLVISCTGQSPNTKVVSRYMPDAISESGYLRTLPTMQLASGKEANVFALGDVAETEGPKMARAAHMQADVVVRNIMKLIRGASGGLDRYVAHPMENSLKLTIGKDRDVLYYDDGEQDMVIKSKGSPDDMYVMRIWQHLSADSTTATA